MKSPDLQLCYRIAKMVLLENKSHKEVAQALKLTRRAVSESLDDARDAQLIKVLPPPNEKLPKKLRERLGSRCPGNVVVHGDGMEGVAWAAARFFEDNAADGDCLVLDGGQTISRMIKSLQADRFKSIQTCPLVADLPIIPDSAYSAAQRVREKYSTCTPEVGPPHWLGRPKLEKIHADAKKFARDAKWVFLGTGPFKKSFTAYEILDSIGLEPERIVERVPDIVGMVGYLAVARNGRVEKLDDDLIRSLGDEEIRDKSRRKDHIVVLLADGAELLDPVLAVL
jgi:hypothetical protein